VRASEKSDSGAEKEKILGIEPFFNSELYLHGRIV